MGNRAAKQPPKTPSHPRSEPQLQPHHLDTLHESYSSSTSGLDDLMEKQCCGVILSSSKNKKMFTWQDTVINFCDFNKGKFAWAGDVLEITRTRSDNIRKYKKDYNDIKYLQKQPTKSQRELTLNASQINKFRTNLKKSVLLHYNEVVSPLTLNEPSRIESSIRLEPSPLPLSQSTTKKSVRSSLIKQSMTRTQNTKMYKKENVMMSFSKMGRNYIRETLRESVIGLVDDTMTSLFKGEEQEVSKLNAYSLEVFIKFTVMLERHLTDPENKVCQIVQAFYSSMYRTYGQIITRHNTSLSVIKELKQSQTPQTPLDPPTHSVANIPDRQFQLQQLSSLQIQQILQGIKTFILLLTQIVQEYYNIREFGDLEQGTNYLINNQENILTVITAIVFKDQRFYAFVFGVIKVFNREKDQRANLLFERIHGKPPEHFSIRKEYCLNAGSVKKFIDEMSSVESNIENLVPEDLESSTDEPYHKCSQALQKIEKCRTPISKMKAILQCAEKITESIIDFYNSNQMQLKNRMIDADQVLNIFCYILSLNRIPNIFSHALLIDYFATDHQKISMTGYYFSVLECAIEESFGESKLQRPTLNITAISEKEDQESRLASLYGSARKPNKN